MTDDVAVWLRGIHQHAERLAQASILDAAGTPGPGVWSIAHTGWAGGPWSGCVDGSCAHDRIEGHGLVIYNQSDDYSGSQAELICLNDPAATLARVEAERRILAHHTSDRDEDYPTCTVCDTLPGASPTYHRPWPCPTVRLLASGWKHMPGLPN